MYDAFAGENQTGVPPKRPGFLAIGQGVGTVFHALRALATAVLTVAGEAIAFISQAFRQLPDRSVLSNR
jgi:hypothetical protein